MSALPLSRKLIVPTLLGLGILATLAREISFANFLGTSRDLEVFRLAFALPNLLSQSLAPAYIGALLPLLVAAQNNSAVEYDGFCRRLARVTLIGVVLITLTGILTAGLQAEIIAPGYDVASAAALRAALTICWIFFLLTGISFLPRLFLNERQEFWPGVSTSLVISSALVVACIAIAPGQVSGRQLAFAAVFAGGVILTFHLTREPRSLELLFGRGAAAVNESSGTILKPLLLVLTIHVANAIPRFVDRAFASEFPQGIVAALEYSYNIITVPGILLGTSIITVFYPAFVRQVQNSSTNVLGRAVVVPVSLSILLAFMVGLAFNFAAEDIVSLVYGRGAFGASAIHSTSTMLAWHGLGLGFMVATLILAQACLAFGVFRLLVLIAMLRIVSKVIAVMWLVPEFGLSGLAASFIVPEFVSTLLLLTLLIVLNRRRAAF